jgi:flagellar biosynthesis/type III secretory pathway chaperone
VSAQSLILKLEKLLGLNRKLYQLAQTKTEALKTEDLTVLQQTLKQEQIYIQAIKQVENERIGLASAYLNREDDLTLSACMEKAEGADKEKFSDLFQSLTDVMEKLKNANKLNQQLTIQALQFVSLSMDMLMPKEQSPAYKPPGGTASEPKRRSLFDSKA